MRTSLCCLWSSKQGIKAAESRAAMCSCGWGEQWLMAVQQSQDESAVTPGHCCDLGPNREGLIMRT